MHTRSPEPQKQSPNRERDPLTAAAISSDNVNGEFSQDEEHSKMVTQFTDRQDNSVNSNQNLSKVAEINSSNGGEKSAQIVEITSAELGEESEHFKPKKAARQIPWLAIGGLGILAIGLTFGWRWWQFQQAHISTDNAQIQGHLSPISSKIPATIQRVLVKAGDKVKAGQTLIVLEDADLDLKVRAATAALASAKAQVASATDTIRLTRQTNQTQIQQAQAKLAASQAAIAAARSSVAQAEAQIAAKQTAIAQAQTEVDKTQADYQRYKSLYRSGGVSAQQFDTARAAYDNARSGLAAATQGVTQAKAELANAQAQLQTKIAEAAAAQGQLQETKTATQTVNVQQDQQKQAQAQVEQATAALALARQQLTYRAITSPVSGYVGQLTAQVGQKVQMGQPLLSVVPLQTDEVYVDANFKETALGKIKIGEKAEVEVDAYPGEKFPATVAGISPATGSNYALIPPDNATGNFNKVVQWVPVRLAFSPDADPQHKLRPGLNVTVTVDVR